MLDRHRIRLHLSIRLGAFLLAGALAGGARAQTRAPAGMGTDTARAPAGDGERAGPAERGPLLDRPVSRSEYHLGPGDVVGIALVGDVNRVETATVTPEGSVVLPTVGVIPVLGLNLNQAEDRVRGRVRELYRTVDVHLTLTEVRMFKVFVIGDVQEPGVRVASSVTRVSEVVPSVDSRGVYRRAVMLRRANGDTASADLARFRLAGELQANPTLHEGDAIIVPVIDRTVRVYGTVDFPGEYEYRPGETLAGLLRLVTGGHGLPASAVDSMRVSRFTGPATRRVFDISASAAFGAEGAAFQLQPFDAIYVAHQAHFREQATANAEGEFQHPGTYPIVPGHTRVTDLVRMAGGFTGEASLSAAQLIRTGDTSESELLQRLRQTPSEFLTAEDQALLTLLPVGASANVVVDLTRLFHGGDSTQNIALQIGDRLEVPRRHASVNVVGAVVRPGLVEYVPGARAQYFVSQAGGFARRANRGDIVVVRAGSSTRVSFQQAGPLGPGDTVVVPYRKPISWMNLLQTAGSTTTMVISLLLLARQF